MSSKYLYMIGGPNGAGKTTSAFSLLPELLHCDEYVNADAIAASLSPFKPESVAIRSGKIMLERINHLAQTNANFAFETTMASRSFVGLLEDCRASGYQVELLYVWLATKNLAIKRVEARTKSGGHSIPAEAILRRYTRSMDNFINLYAPLADSWSIYDNSGLQPELVSEKKSDSAKIVVNKGDIWQAFEAYKK